MSAMRVVPCDKCERPNDRADDSNYCSECAAAYQKRIAAEYETRPVGAAIACWAGKVGCGILFDEHGHTD